MINMTDDINRNNAATDDLTDDEMMDIIGDESNYDDDPAMADIARQLDAAASGRPITPLPASVAAAIAADNAAQAAGTNTPADTTPAQTTDTTPAPQAANTAAATSGSSGSTMKHDRDGLIRYLVDDYLAANPVSLPELLDRDGDAPEHIRQNLLDTIRLQLELENAARAKGDKIKSILSLPGYIVARILLSTGDIRTLITGSEGHRMAAKHYYRPAGSAKYKWAGTYDLINETDSAGPIMLLFQRLCPDGNAHDERTFCRELRNAPRCSIQSDNRLVWWRNGVWDYNRKAFTSYDDPDFDALYPTQITLTKLPVYHPYGPYACLHPDANGYVAEPVLHNDKDGTDWRPSQMLTDPFDMDTDTGKASSLIIWQAMQFLVRRMNGAPHLYHFWINKDGRGKNGKSTIWDMMHRLIEIDQVAGRDDDLVSCGDKVIPLPVDRLDEDYILAQSIMTAYAIVGEESNGSVTYIDKCATAKMLARAQELIFRMIREAPFRFRFDGFLLQQSNQAPHFSEKNDSVISHTVVIPFERHFGDSTSYIKDQYVKREDVAEWLAYHLTVEMDCLDGYDLDALAVLEPYKREMLIESMPTLQCLDDIIPGLHMDFMPLELLYDLYSRWCDKNGERPVTQRMMREDVKQYAISNQYGIRYVGTDERPRIKLPELDQRHPALAEFGYSRRLGKSDFVDNRANTLAGQSAYSSCLERSVMVSVDSKGHVRGKTWGRGGLMRTAPWQSQIVDDDTDND